MHLHGLCLLVFRPQQKCDGCCTCVSQRTRPRPGPGRIVGGPSSLTKTSPEAVSWYPPPAPLTPPSPEEAPAPRDTLSSHCHSRWPRRDSHQAAPAPWEAGKQEKILPAPPSRTPSLERATKDHWDPPSGCSFHECPGSFRLPQVDCSQPV